METMPPGTPLSWNRPSPLLGPFSSPPPGRPPFPVFPDYSRTKKTKNLLFPLPPPFLPTKSRGILPLSTALDERGKAMADSPDKSPLEGRPTMEATCEATMARAVLLPPLHRARIFPKEGEDEVKE